MRQLKSSVLPLIGGKHFPFRFSFISPICSVWSRNPIWLARNGEDMQDKEKSIETQSEILGEDLHESSPKKSRYYGTPKDVVDAYTRCNSCGSRLHFSHLTDFANNMTQESVRCLECEADQRVTIYQLQ